MTLGELRKLITEYNQTFYLRKLFYGDHEQATKLKHFLSNFTQDDDYSLMLSEEFKFARLLSSLENNIKLIKDFNRLFQDTALFSKLYSIMIFDEENLCDLYKISEEKLDFLHNFFCESIFKISERDLSKELKYYFQLLNSRNLLNEDAFRLIENNAQYPFSLFTMLKILADAKQLNARNLSFIAQATHLNIFLEKINSIDSTILKLIFSKKNLPKLELVFPVLDSVSRFDLDNQVLYKLEKYSLEECRFLAEIIKELNQKKLLTNEQFHQLLRIKSLYYKRLSELISILEKEGLLNEDTLSKLFINFGNKFPLPEEEPFTIELENYSDNLCTLYQGKDKNLLFFAKNDPNKPCWDGSQGDVIQVTSLHENETLYSLKKLKGEEEEDYREVAIRETKYARFFGRKAHFFQNSNQWYVISEWQTGRTLQEIPKKELITLPKKMRIKSLIHLLKELNQLHSQYRAHCDIKKNNIVFNTKTFQLKLIDFGFTGKVKPKKYLPWTYRFYDDICALGFVVAELFPEIYEVREGNDCLEVALYKSVWLLSIEELSIYYLVSSMLSREEKIRCTSQRALDYCERLLNTTNISKKELAKILGETLNKNELSFNDVLHDRSLKSQTSSKCTCSLL